MSFTRVKQILDDSVGGANFGAHGAFWRGQTRDQFVAHSVFGQQLVILNDGANSNLVKALKGEPPFGSDSGSSGAIFRRMPGGRPPVASADIQFIEDWINNGAPESDQEVLFDFNAGGPASDLTIHNNYWRDFDNWAMFEATPETRQNVNTMMGAAPKWMAFANDSSLEQEWRDEIESSMVLDPMLSLAENQIKTLSNHYGNPVEMKTVVESYERFGDDSLPDDPLRPADDRHNMNGSTMWFFWSAFCDGLIRHPELVKTHAFGLALARVVLLGLMNDGLFRGRFTVEGFDANEAGKIAMRSYILNLGDDQLQDELVKRFVDTQP